MIHQELNLFPSMTVAENIWLGREPLTRIGLVNHRALGRRTSDLLAGLKIDIHPDERIADLPIAGRQMVEIARALSVNAAHPDHGRTYLGPYPQREVGRALSGSCAACPREGHGHRLSSRID